MKFNFKIQQYQTDAVKAVADVFAGQANNSIVMYTRDLGKSAQEYQLSMDGIGVDENVGYRNRDIDLSDLQLLDNIKSIQSRENIMQSGALSQELGRCALDIEMETGTGKTYVYIKTMFELNKKYGWTKFIVVVPSIAIREGVYKTFQMIADHFMESYGKKARFFVYNSNNLQQLADFAKDAGIQVMIINTQAFATSFKEDTNSKKKNKGSRLIYSESEILHSRRPIDVIAANRPIIILDEPQKMSGAVTKAALQKFNPLFALYYSATHRENHNKVYVLDALDAYNQKLVKQIEVKDFSFKNPTGTDGYLYFSSIIVSDKQKPKAKLELEIKYDNGIKRKSRIVSKEDDLYYISKEMNQYKGYVIADIDANNRTITFSNHKVMYVGDMVGDVAELDKRKIQIKETIRSHLEKEQMLFGKGIKCLSLFFIDEVSKYRLYDDNGNETLGEYGKIFEEQYAEVVGEMTNTCSEEYYEYLLKTLEDLHSIHRGYFSIDKKTGRCVNSEVKRGQDYSDDISAYGLIMKNKERLLSFEEPTRFIFSHSALREGWDNPNIFQICTLKHSNSEVSKRQEIGRGLRLCVNKDGNRMDVGACGEDVHIINKLTVIVVDGEGDFASKLQDELKASSYNRPTKASVDYFEGKTVSNGVESVLITKNMAEEIRYYLIVNNYSDKKGSILSQYREDAKNNSLPTFTDSLTGMDAGIHRLIQSIYCESAYEDMVKDARATKITQNPLNENFKKKQFQELWNTINHQYAYMVCFDSGELIQKSIKAINKELLVSTLVYEERLSSQADKMTITDLESKKHFTTKSMGTKKLEKTNNIQLRYDLVGDLAEDTKLTRKTIVSILKGLSHEKILMFERNPEEFISKVTKLINEQKANTVVDHITYNELDHKYDSSIFVESFSNLQFDRVYAANNAIQDYVLVDGISENCVEKKFVESLDSSADVEVFAKLPKGFHIPTPVGNYSPDWAIAFKDDDNIKHIYFIAETKGSLGSLELKGVEKIKTDCAKKLFNELSTRNVKYGIVTNYDDLMDKVMNN